jgi:hypothetical protein
MSTQTNDATGLEANRLAMFAGVFIAGIIGGVVFTSTLAHSQQTRFDRMPPTSATVRSDAGMYTADPSLPDAATVLRARRNDRPEAIAPTF